MDSSVERQSSTGAAFFDLDKTIISKSSAMAFGRAFYQGGLMTRLDVLRNGYAQLAFRLAGADHDTMERLRASISALATGWSVEEIQRIVADSLQAIIEPAIYREAMALIAEHHAAGRPVVIVSASGTDVVEPIAALLGVEHVIATRMGVAEGQYTGEISFYPYGEAKAEAVRAFADTHGYDLSRCYAYSDSVTDLPMLAAVGFPHAVNPDRALRREAMLRGWPILDFTPPDGIRTVVLRRGVPLAVGMGAVAAGVLWYVNRRPVRPVRPAPRATRLRQASTSPAK